MKHLVLLAFIAVVGCSHSATTTHQDAILTPSPTVVVVEDNPTVLLYPGPAVPLSPYPYQEHVAPHGELGYVHSLDASYVPMPHSMALTVNQVWLTCEINLVARLTKDPYADLSAIVSSTNDYGQSQLNRGWEYNVGGVLSMDKLGLNFDDEGDRIAFDVVLYEYYLQKVGNGWDQWSCKP